MSQLVSCGMRRVLTAAPNRIRHLKQIRLMTSFYSQFVMKGDLCFDVGANLGDRTEAFVRLGGRVVAIEPQDFCMEQLRRRYRNNSNVILVQKAVGDKEGKAELMLSKWHTISSLSREWIRAVQASGRFAAYTWDNTATVPMTTLDKLIEEYGRPVFCKIDVEGFEFQVVKGLSVTIRALSFEFVPEFIDSSLDCISHLSSLGRPRFNYSVWETMTLQLPKWIGPEEMRDTLQSLPDKSVFGDVYARFPD
jgi:FkbM family methyltransferase